MHYTSKWLLKNARNQLRNMLPKVSTTQRNMDLNAVAKSILFSQKGRNGIVHLGAPRFFFFSKYDDMARTTAAKRCFQNFLYNIV